MNFEASRRLRVPCSLLLKSFFNILTKKIQKSKILIADSWITTQGIGKLDYSTRNRQGRDLKRFALYRKLLLFAMLSLIIKCHHLFYSRSGDCSDLLYYGSLFIQGGCTYKRSTIVDLFPTTPPPPTPFA